MFRLHRFNFVLAAYMTLSVIIAFDES